jgi:UDP-glucose 4-epimerase
VKYLITGGAGFIGSHLSECLVDRGDQVVILDNLSTGYLSNLDRSKGVVEFIEGDVLDKPLVENLVSECDFVIHLAAALGVLNIVKKPLSSLKTNLQGSEVVLEACNLKSKPVLIASTSEIYGKNNKPTLSEEDDRILGHPLKSRWSYSEAKAVDESLAYFLYLETRLPIRIVRLFNTVGPRQVGHYGMVVPRFVDAALRNEYLQVYGSGNQIRCFCHVKDTVRAILAVADSGDAIGQVFNIGHNQQISIMELARKVIFITGSKSEIKNISYSQAYPDGYEDMQHRVPDISKIYNVLGWKPEIELDEIIRDVVGFIKAKDK